MVSVYSKFAQVNVTESSRETFESWTLLCINDTCLISFSKPYTAFL